MFQSRYHAARAHHMGRGDSPRCASIVSLPPKIDGKTTVFTFDIDGFHHQLFIHWDGPLIIDESFFMQTAIGIAVAEVYRLAEIVFPKTISFPWYSCSRWERDWWNEDIQWYLQQKIYLEGWSWQEIPRMDFGDDASSLDAFESSVNDTYLLGVSGGKESTFAFEWFRRTGLSVEALTLHFEGGPYKNAWRSKFPIFSPIRAETTFHEIRMHPGVDPAVHFGYEGIRNDPTITNALFVMMQVAASRGHRFLVLANDKSANEENATHEGKAVNHQSAKGGDYIGHFNEYLKHKSLPFRYVSACEHVYSLAATQYLSAWKPDWVSLLCSCNEVQWDSGDQRWCRRCPKCLFSYALIEASLDRARAIETVGEDLILVPELEGTWRSLFQPHLAKPLECVGERRETETALALLKAKRQERGEPVGFLKQVDLQTDLDTYLHVDAPGGLPKSHRVRLMNAIRKLDG